MTNARHFAMSIGLVAAVSMGGANAQIYKWVDDKGRTHYGQQPPAASAAVPKKLDIEVTGNDLPRAAAICYSIQCQYERMRDDRLLREAEWRKDEESWARIAAQRRAAQEPPAPAVDPRWSGVYPGGGIIGGRPIYRPRVPIGGPVRQPSAPAEPAVSIRMPGE